MDTQVPVAADIVVTGRNVEVPAHYRVHIAEKLARLERYGSHVSRIVRYDVVLGHEKNPRLSKVCQRVEITGRGTGPTVRAEACGSDFYPVLDEAVGKLQETLRRSHDRRRVHHGRHQPVSVAAATAPLAPRPHSCGRRRPGPPPRCLDDAIGGAASRAPGPGGSSAYRFATTGGNVSGVGVGVRMLF
ncbi:MAG: hypothetical protein QOI16_1065, partial [Pseudonocardiales bacterium]|nr:hypothetical protein [Pseudonocardiales bacterium]